MLREINLPVKKQAEAASSVWVDWAGLGRKGSFLFQEGGSSSKILLGYHAAQGSWEKKTH